MKHTINFAHESETKNKQRFQELPDQATKVGADIKFVIGTVYVDKAIAGTAKTLTVTLDIPDEPVAPPAA